MNVEQIKNEKLSEYPFLKEMYEDEYFPNSIVDKGKKILIDLCLEIEKENPKDLPALYTLTHAATEGFNRLDEELNEHDSEIETVAREIIAADFDFIAEAFGYEADVEELIAPREW